MSTPSRWFSRITLFTLVLIMMYGALSATETRVNSLGGRGIFIYDDTNIFLFPATLVRYSGAVIGEFRSKEQVSTYTVGANIPLTKTMDAAIYLNRPFNLMAPSNPTANATVNTVTDVFWSNQLAEYDVAARFTIGLDSYSADNGTVETTERARYIAFGGGISNELFNAGALIDLPGAKRKVGNNSNSWSGFGIGLNGRAHLIMNNALTIVPAMQFYYRKSSAESDFSNSSSDYGRMNLFLGGALRYSVSENNLFLLGIEGLGLDRHAEKSGGTHSSMTSVEFPGVYVGVESQVTSWLVGRLGARQLSTSYIQKSNSGTETRQKTKSKSFDISLGLSIEKGNFILDAAINEGIFFDSVYFISGYPQHLANQISVVYVF